MRLRTAGFFSLTLSISSKDIIGLESLFDLDIASRCLVPLLESFVDGMDAAVGIGGGGGGGSNAGIGGGGGGGGRTAGASVIFIVGTTKVAGAGGGAGAGFDVVVSDDGPLNKQIKEYLIFLKGDINKM